MRKLFVSVALLFVVVLSCFAADITGSWKGVVKIPNRDDIELTYRLKTDGETLTGSVISQYGEIPLLDGKIKDDRFSFKMEIGEYVVEQTGMMYQDSIVIKSNFRGTDLRGTFTKVK